MNSKQVSESLDCPKCGSSNTKKDGREKATKRQVIKCVDCKKKSVIGADSRVSLESQLPFYLTKPTSELTPGELYSLGWLITDGSIDDESKVCITLQARDVEALKVIKRELKFPNNVIDTKDSREPEKIYKRLQWKCKLADDYWGKLGLVHQKTYNKVWLPYMENPHFVRGIWDGDGNISNTTTSKTLRISCIDKTFLAALKSYVETFLSIEGYLSFDRHTYLLQYH